MRMMKIKRFRAVCISLLLGAILFLSACADGASDRKQAGSDDVLASGNLQKNLPPGEFADYGDSVLFFAFNGSAWMLYEIDKETLSTEPFCKDPSCSHQDARCVMNGVSGHLENAGGVLYALRDDTVFTESGVNEQYSVMKLKNGRFEAETTGIGTSFLHGNGKLYASTKDGSFVRIEDGKKKEEILMDEYTGMWPVLSGTRLIFLDMSEGVMVMDTEHPDSAPECVLKTDWYMTDGESIFYTDYASRLYRCDLSGKNSEVLVDASVLPASVNFDEKYVYFRYFSEDGDLRGGDCTGIYRILKNGGSIEKLADLPVLYAYTIYTIPDYDRIFVNAYESADTAGSGTYFAVSKDGSGYEKLLLPDL